MSFLRNAIVLVAALALLAGGIAASATSHETGSAFAAEGEGVRASGLLEDARTVGLPSARSIAGAATLPSLDAERSLLVVAHPGRPYGEDELEAIDGFLADGGTVLVADASGEANSLLAPHGLLIERVLLAEPNATTDFAVGSRSLPVPLQAPTALQVLPDAQATLLASSSAGSFLDRDGDGLVAAGDLPGPFPVAASVAVGKGRLVAVADDQLLAAKDDSIRAWRRALLGNLLPDGGLVLVDESHGGVADPLLAGAGTAANAARLGNWKYGVAGVAAVAAVAAAVPGSVAAWGPHEFRPFRFRRRSDPEAEAEALPTGSFWLPRGTVAVCAAVALALLSLVTGSQQAAWAAAFMGVAAAAALQPRLPRIKATRRVEPLETSEGAEVEVRVETTSAIGRAPGLELRDVLPDSMEVREGHSWALAQAKPGGEALAYKVSPALRGLQPIGPFVARRTDALQLRVRQASVVPATKVRVAPSRQDVRRLPFNTRVPTITLGPHLVNRAGDGSEFQALRTYQSGDSMRTVNWKASARSRDLMVNQRVHESQALLTVFLDARAVSGAGPAAESALAQGCRAVFSVVSGALRMRDRLRFVSYGDGVRELDSRGAAQMHDLTDLLARIKPAGTTGLGDAVARVMPNLRPGLPVLIASGLEDDPTLVPAVRELRGRGLLVTVLAARLAVEPTDPADGEGDPDGKAILARRDETMAQLRGLGVTVHDARPGVPLDLLFKLGAA